MASKNASLTSVIARSEHIADIAPHHSLHAPKSLQDASTVRAYHGPVGALESYNDRLTREVATLAAKVEMLARKAAAFDLISAKPGEAGLEETSRALTGSSIALIDWMKVNGWIHRRHGGSWMPFADKCGSRGYLVVRELPDECRENHSHLRTLVTPKGRAKLAKLLGHEDRHRDEASPLSPKRPKRNFG
jgi:phage antirepressor YoqD-like protein